jgi:ParB-like nuclease domain
MQIRDRIRELRRVPAAQLRPHPKNWRTHPAHQRDALQGILAEVGYAGALLARELEDGSLELIDGHLRAETTPEMEVPVLVLDVTAAEAAKLLTVLDPLASLAEANGAQLAAIVAEIETDSTAVRSLLDRLSQQANSDQAPLVASAPALESQLQESFQVVVECHDEAEQRTIYERLCGEGFSCRLLVL